MAAYALIYPCDVRESCKCRSVSPWCALFPRSPYIDDWMDGRKGTNGVCTNGVIANVSLFDRGTLGVPLTYLYLPKSARAYLFQQSINIIYIFSGPISVDLICPQPRWMHV